MSLENLMTRKVVSVEPDTAIREVINHLHAYRISCVVVCKDDLPIGIITERDVVGLAFNMLSASGESREQAGELMSPSVTTIPESADLHQALAVAEENRIRHLPVVDDTGALVGLLTQTDLLRARMRRGSGDDSESA